LAQASNTFYHEYPVLHEENREKRIFLLWMTEYFPLSIGAHSGDSWHRRAGVHVTPVNPPGFAL
jgi:hypothetical protein